MKAINNKKVELLWMIHKTKSRPQCGNSRTYKKYMIWHDSINGINLNFRIKEVAMGFSLFKALRKFTIPATHIGTFISINTAKKVAQIIHDGE